MPSRRAFLRSLLSTTALVAGGLSLTRVGRPERFDIEAPRDFDTRKMVYTSREVWWISHDGRFVQYPTDFDESEWRG